MVWDWRSPYHWSRYKVVAWFPGMDAAREAISSLGGSGIEAANISLLGAPAAQAAANTDVRDADTRVTEYVAKRAVVGAMVGVAGGAFAGFLFGGLTFAIAGIGSALGPGVWVATACGAILGSVVGGLISGESALDIAEGWELTFHPSRKGTYWSRSTQTIGTSLTGLRRSWRRSTPSAWTGTAAGAKP